MNENTKQSSHEAASAEEMQQALSESRAEAEKLRQILTQREKEEEQRQYRDQLRALLENAGANPAALELMTLQSEAYAKDGKSPEEAVTAMRSRWDGLFTTRKTLPVKPIAPQGAGLTLTREDVQSMTSEEINRSWDMVKGVLAQRY